MKLAEISIKRPSIVIVILAALIIGGLFSYSQLSYELIPKFEVKVVTVSTLYPGAAPAEVENSVTRKIEDAVSSLQGVKKIQSKSFESVSVVIIEFNNDADVDLALNDAQRKINAIKADLPEDVEEPSLTQFSISDLPIINAGVTANMTQEELYDLIDQRVQPEISRIAGVASVNIIGGQEREIRVNLDQNRLDGYGLTIPQIEQVIAASNLDFPTGSLRTRRNNTLIRMEGKLASVEQLRNLTIASNNGMNIRLSDVAEVEDTTQRASKIARVNGQNTILLQIQKQTDANAVEVSKLVQEQIARIEKQYDTQHLKIQVASDTSVFTKEAANSVIKDLFIAVALVAFVMLFFLQSFRNAVIVMVSIPTSLIATFIGIFILGYTLNLLSLLGLSLVVGILVDDAIVVIENIHRHMEMGKNKVRAAYDGASEIGFTVTAITLVIVVVFLPIALSSGLVSDIIKQFCMTVVIATLLSLLVSFSVVPWLFSRFGKLEHIGKGNFLGKIIGGFDRGIDWFTKKISGIMQWSLHHKIITLLITVGLLVGSIMLPALGFVGSDFFPATDKGEVLFQFELPKDASLEETNFATQRAERILSATPGVVRQITTVGQSSGGFGALQTTDYKSEINVKMLPRNERGGESTKVAAARIKRQLEQQLVGVKISTVPMGFMGAEDAPLQMVITGNTAADAMKYAEQAAAVLRKVPGSAQVKLSVEDGNPEIAIQVDRDKMTSLGLNVATVGMTLRTAFSGNDNNKFRTGSNEYNINIILDEGQRRSVDDIRNITFQNQQGQKIQLGQFATVNTSSGPSVLERYNRTPSVTVQSQTIGRAAGSIATDWTDKLAAVQKPKGVEWTWTGTMENQSEGFGTLGYALMAAMLLVYMIMVILYNDFLKPVVVMFSVPLSFIGALMALALTNQSLNIFTLLGIIMLIGLVTKNAILLVDFANHRMDHGEDVETALLQANHARLRPILMTTIAMVFGMLPIAMASGAAAEMNNGLAIVIIGGLLSSLFLTLVIVPVMYYIIIKLEHRFGKHKKMDYAAEMQADYEHLHPKEEFEF